MLGNFQLFSVRFHCRFSEHRAFLFLCGGCESSTQCRELVLSALAVETFSDLSRFKKTNPQISKSDYRSTMQLKSKHCVHFQLAILQNTHFIFSKFHSNATSKAAKRRQTTKPCSQVLSSASID